MPRSLFAADGTMLHCSAKSKLMDILEKMSSADTSDVAPHSPDTTNISNVPLKKLLSHTATNDVLTVFLSKYFLEFSKENKLYNVAWQNKAEASHRDGM